MTARKATPGQKRIDALRAAMRQHSMDALLVTRREDVRYLSGFTGSAGSVLVAKNKTVLITDFRYQLQARKETSGISISIQKGDFYASLRDAAEQMRVSVVWFDESSFTVEAVNKLKKVGLRAKGSRDLVRQLRLRKDRREINNISLAVKRAESAFRELARYIKPGATERFLGSTLECLMRDLGSRKPAFDTIVASAGNGAMPHASVTDRKIRSGDLVTFDFGAEANGYFSDMTRTLCVGRPSARQREIHALVLSAQAAALCSIRPGVSCKDVDNEARELIRRAGHDAHFGHGTGHGIGLMVHEGPSVSPLSSDSVDRDMVFTVEPGVYIPGWGGVRIEDMVLVTAAGYTRLTSLPTDIDLLKRLKN
jgi:Xaa-Pro aminopeptidase